MARIPARKFDPPMPVTVRNASLTEWQALVFGIECRASRRRLAGSEGQVGDGDEVKSSIILWVGKHEDEEHLAQRPFATVVESKTESFVELVAECGDLDRDACEALERELYR